LHISTHLERTRVGLKRFDPRLGNTNREGKLVKVIVFFKKETRNDEKKKNEKRVYSSCGEKL
jgi:hypothetical protein